MTLGASRMVLVLGVAALPALACQTDRDRPGPPKLTLTLDQDSIESPDTLTGAVRADDVDGIDSVFLSVDSEAPRGADGLLEPTFFGPFQIPVRAGHIPGDLVPIQVTARDIAGYVSVLDTFVIVRGP
ncbi:MAG: hypothetical protein ACREMF_01750 [Gemmatimonadales bacterium]